jgi:hypothetical protein
LGIEHSDGLYVRDFFLLPLISFWLSFCYVVLPRAALVVGRPSVMLIPFLGIVLFSPLRDVQINL